MVDILEELTIKVQKVMDFEMWAPGKTGKTPRRTPRYLSNTSGWNGYFLQVAREIHRGCQNMSIHFRNWNLLVELYWQFHTQIGILTYWSFRNWNQFISGRLQEAPEYLAVRTEPPNRGFPSTCSLESIHLAVARPIVSLLQLLQLLVGCVWT